MNDTVFWGMGLAVCWTVGWLLTFVEAGSGGDWASTGARCPLPR